MKIFIVGSLNMDLVIGAPRVPKSGMTIEGTGFMTNAGGKSLISNYENQYSTPDIYTICMLAEIFDVSLDELVEYEKDDPDP